MQEDYSIFERISINELIQSESKCNDCSDSSDHESVKSDKNDYLSDEEVKNKYSFLISFKKRRPKRTKKQSKPVVVCVKEESYQSE